MSVATAEKNGIDFKTILDNALEICGAHADDPFLLYCALCDCAGSDYALSPQVETFHYFNKTYRLVAEMKKNPDPKMIGVLLESCKGQPDAPVKQCLRWIHSLFVYFYRASNIPEEQTERILKSIEQDFFEPEQEGLVLAKPKKANKKAPRKAHNAVGNVTPAPQIAAPAPIRSVRVGGAQPSLKIIRASIPYIPDKAWVYVAKGSPIVHISAECPHICPSLKLTIYRATYERAKYKDFVRINNLKKNTSTYYYLSQNHCPPICPKCGEFTPILSYRTPKREYKQL